MTPYHHHRSFTLLELMAVSTLMLLVVGMAVFRLDGVSERVRLCSAAGQVASVVRLAAHEAQTTGEPRRMDYLLGSDAVILREPLLREGAWRWDEGRQFQTATGVRIERILMEGADPIDTDPSSIRIDPSGRFRVHAVLLSLHGRAAAVWLSPVERQRCVFLETPVEDLTFETLESLLEQHDEAP